MTKGAHVLLTSMSRRVSDPRQKDVEDQDSSDRLKRQYQYLGETWDDWIQHQEMAKVPRGLPPTQRTIYHDGHRIVNTSTFEHARNSACQSPIGSCGETLSRKARSSSTGTQLARRGRAHSHRPGRRGHMEWQWNGQCFCDVSRGHSRHS